MSKRILILDFKNLSPDKADNYLCNSVPVEIKHLLSQNKNLKVISTSSKSLLQSEFGKSIKVDFFLEGSFLSGNHQIRFNFQLIKGNTATCVLSIKLDEHSDNIFKVIDLAASKIVGHLELEFQADKSHPKISPQAYKYYLKGIQYWDLWDKSNVKKAIDYFYKVTDLEPDFAMAYLQLSHCYSLLAALVTKDSLKNYNAAKSAAIKAIGIDNTSIEAHLSLALIKLVNDLDILGAYYSFENAFAIDNSNKKAHHYYAYYLISIGKYAKAIEALEFVLKEDPINLQVNSTYGFALLLHKKYVKAETHLKKTLSLYPNSEVTLDALIWTYIMSAQYNKAKKLIENCEIDLTLSPAIEIIVYNYLGISSKSKHWQKKLDTLLENDTNGKYSKEASALYFAMGDIKNGAKHFEIFYKDKMGFIRALSHPAWQSFRESDKFYIYKKRLKLLKPPVLPNELTGSNANIIVMHSSTAEIFTVDSKRLLYIKSEGVYCSIVFLNKDNVINLKILRTSLTKIIKDTFYVQFFRCHNSFIVNTKIPYLISGNRKNAKLSLNDYSIEVPVSRNSVSKAFEVFDVAT